MKSFSLPLRGLSLIAAAGLAASVLTLAGTATAAASSCPVVNSDRTVTPPPAPGVDWSGCDLSGANMTDADLSGANLTDANLDAASLAYATLTGATLTGATMSTTTTLAFVTSGQIIGSPDLPAGFSYQVQAGYIIGPFANLVGANLSGTDLAGADLYGAFLQSAHLAGANLPAPTWRLPSTRPTSPALT